MRRAVRRLRRPASIVFWCAVVGFFVFSASVGIYGLITHQGDDFYNRSPWGMIAVPGYFVWIPVPFLIAFGLLRVGWGLVVWLGAPRHGDVRGAWLSDKRSTRPILAPAVLEVTAWSTGVVGVLLFLWGSPFLPSGVWFLPAVVFVALGTSVLLLRWTGWHDDPYVLARVIAGVVAGVLLAIAYSLATRPTAPDLERASLALLGAGALAYYAVTMQFSD